MSERLYTLAEVEAIAAEARHTGAKIAIQALIDTWCESDDPQPITLEVLQSFLEDQDA